MFYLGLSCFCRRLCVLAIESIGEKEVVSKVTLPIAEVDEGIRVRVRDTCLGRLKRVPHGKILVSYGRLGLRFAFAPIQDLCFNA